MAVLSCALIAVTAAATAGANDRPSGVDDGPNFNVQLLTGALRVPPVGSRSYVMTKKNGKRYRCHLPNSNGQAIEAEERDAPRASPPLHSYLTQLAGACFYRLEGWWTYEFCYLKHFRQYHQEKAKTQSEVQITQDYTLGSWWVEKADSKAAKGSAVGANVAADLREDAKTRKQFWSQTYGNGTTCDMTGKPRETEVRLMCSGGEPSHLASVEEVATCKYVVHFATNLLCKHPSFAADNAKDLTQTIQCEPLDADGRPIPAPKKPPKKPPSLAAAAADGSPGGPGRSAADGAAGNSAQLARARKLEVGTCVLHLKFNYRGVVVGRDESCRQSAAWRRANGIASLRHGELQPFYHVLADTRDRPGRQIMYVAQELLEVDTPAEKLQHPLIAEYFASFDAPNGRFVPTDELRVAYPEDGGSDAERGSLLGTAAARGEAGSVTATELEAVEDKPDSASDDDESSRNGGTQGGAGDEPAASAGADADAHTIVDAMVADADADVDA